MLNPYFNTKSMEETKVLTDTIIDWAATRSDEIVFTPTAGYYSFDIVMDAWKKGKEEGKEQFIEEVRGKYFNNAKLTTEALLLIIQALSKYSFFPNKVFINISIEGSSILLAIKEQIYTSEKFITNANEEASKLKLEFFEKGLNLQIGFLNDSPTLDISLLKSDGFGFAFDYDKKKIID